MPAAPADLHHRDVSARRALRNLLTARRRELHLSQANLAALCGLSTTRITMFETRNPDLRVGRTQLIARHLDMQLLAYPTGLPGGPYPDPAAEVFRPSDPGDADRWDRDQTRRALTAAREASGVSQHELAQRLGTCVSYIRRIENTDEGRMVATWQRYCRALGGALYLDADRLYNIDGIDE